MGRRRGMWVRVVSSQGKMGNTWKASEKGFGFYHNEMDRDWCIFRDISFMFYKSKCF
jgi:hypothetical protein